MEKEEGGRRRRRATAEPGDGADSVVEQMMLWHRWLGGGHRADGVRWGQGVWVGLVVYTERCQDGGSVACLGCPRLTRCLCVGAQEDWFWSTVLGPSNPWTKVIHLSCSLKSLILNNVSCLTTTKFAYNFTLYNIRSPQMTLKCSANILIFFNHSANKRQRADII